MALRLDILCHDRPHRLPNHSRRPPTSNLLWTLNTSWNWLGLRREHQSSTRYRHSDGDGDAHEN